VGEIIARAAVEAHLRAVLAANDPKAVVLISCSHSLPEGSLSVLLGRHGAINPAGRVRCNIVPIAKGYNGASQRCGCPKNCTHWYRRSGA
jgi:hypothetical protein